jgi:hypothetical protein
MPGGALVVLGLLLLVLMIAFPQRLRVPALVGYLVAATFGLAGLLALANEFCGRGPRAWLAVALLACMVAPAIWIAVFPGERSCSLRIGLLRDAAGDSLCRGAFGVGAVLGLFMLFMALRHALTVAEDGN